MNLRLVRQIFTAQSTIGQLYVNGTFQCWTLEDIDRELTSDMPPDMIAGVKVHGRTAIPRGTYRVVVDYSQKYERNMPRLLSVPGFTGIRIHSGNNQFHTEGCILVGVSHGENEIYNSRQAYRALFNRINPAHVTGETIFISVEKADSPPLAGLPPVPAVAVGVATKVGA